MNWNDYLFILDDAILTLEEVRHDVADDSKIDGAIAKINEKKHNILNAKASAKSLMIKMVIISTLLILLGCYMKFVEHSSFAGWTVLLVISAIVALFSWVALLLFPKNNGKFE